MIELGIKTVGLKEARGFLRTIEKQMPFATAKALTVTARDVRDEVTKELPKHLDKPVPFTKRAFGYESATKKKLQARVFAKGIQAQYLWWAVEGGTESSMIQPVNVKLNRYGNIPKKKLQKLMARPDVFYGTIKGITGLWQRGRQKGSKFVSQVSTFRGPRKQTGYKFKVGNFQGLKLLAVRRASVGYKKRFDFHALSQRVMDQKWQGNLNEAWRLALATAK